MYRNKCGADVSRFFAGQPTLDLYQCSLTTMRFWRPEIAGDAAFYKDLSERWLNYYRHERWEYQHAREAIPRGARVLEVGCGQGFFLRSLEGHAVDAVGLELNADAINRKVTHFEMRNLLVDEQAGKEGQAFDAVCSFQVLEHVPDPAAFVKSCLTCLRPGGKLIISTPNYDHLQHRRMEDAFDLPPHHLNHFGEAAYRALAQLCRLQLVGLHTQADATGVLSLRLSDEYRGLHRRVRRGVNALLARLLGTRAQPGHTLMGVFVK